MCPVKAVVMGVGGEDGLGAALSRYGANRHQVLVAGRTPERAEKVASSRQRFHAFETR